MPPEARGNEAPRAEEKETFELATEREASSRRAVDSAVALVKERFEDNPDEKERLPFHNVEHTRSVIRRAEAVVDAVARALPGEVTERDKALARIAAAFHDTVQEWEPNATEDQNGPKVMRRRFITKNEAASVVLAVGHMQEANAEWKGRGMEGEIYTEEDMRIVADAIDSTVPGFDPEMKTVVQPNLSKESSLVARAVALADLGEAGTDAEAYARNGDALFREENLDVLDAVKDTASLSSERKEQLRKRMLGWSKFQPSFARGRKALLDKEREGLPDAARAEVAKLFTEFDGSIGLADEIAKRRETMNFEELAKDMGYTL